MKFGIVALAVVALGGLLTGGAGAAGPGAVSGMETVEFASDDGTNLWGWMSYPDGNGPFPAVILLHGCSGTTQDRNGGVWNGLKRHAATLNDRGYATLIVDSLGPRKWSEKDSCLKSYAYRNRRTSDAYGALQYLQSVPNVIGDRVAVLGFSQGGSSALQSVSEYAPQMAKTAARFRVAVAYYPWCGGAYGVFQTPVLVLIGGKDDWTPAERCIAIRRGYQFLSDLPFDVIVYPTAYHSFDLPIRLQSYLGHSVGYDEDAYADSKIRMLDFLEKHL